MKNIYLTILLCALFINEVTAQMSSPVRVKAGEDIYERLAKEVYLYPAFTKGTVLFRDGQSNDASLNYNMLNGEIQFIDARGDTLSLANELTIKYVTIAKDSFYYSNGYVQLVSANENAKVVKKQIIRIIDRQKIGGYDQPSSAGSITAYSAISGNLKYSQLDIRQDLILAKQTSYLIGDKYNNFFKVTKKNLMKYFPKKENELNDYLKKNNVNFDRPDDLVVLISLLID